MAKPSAHKKLHCSVACMVMGNPGTRSASAPAKQAIMIRNDTCGGASSCHQRRFCPPRSASAHDSKLGVDSVASVAAIGRSNSPVMKLIMVVSDAYGTDDTGIGRMTP